MCITNDMEYPNLTGFDSVLGSWSPLFPRCIICAKRVVGNKTFTNGPQIKIFWTAQKVFTLERFLDPLHEYVIASDVSFPRYRYRWPRPASTGWWVSTVLLCLR